MQSIGINWENGNGDRAVFTWKKAHASTERADAAFLADLSQSYPLNLFLGGDQPACAKIGNADIEAAVT